jgi:hypothetical protein
MEYSSLYMPTAVAGYLVHVHRRKSGVFIYIVTSVSFVNGKVCVAEVENVAIAANL